MQARPNRVQTAIELVFHGLQNNIVGANMDRKMAVKWFPFIATLALFIFFSNLIGFIPLPTNTEHEFTLFGLNIPSFSLYAATANLSIPLVFALVVFISYTAEGIRVKGPMAGFIFVLEVLSNVMRLLSLSVRLFANILAGHLIILFMAGALAVLLGVAWLGWF